jgi:luciferase family oxidoreductase group 1
VLELMAYFQPVTAGQHVRAVPGVGLDVPIWILGSSLFGAQLAAELGLPFAFASHFAPAMLLDAAEMYRVRFRPSERLERPYFMVGVNIIAADSDPEARRLFTSLQQAFVNIRRGQPAPLPPPVAVDALSLTPMDELGLSQMLSYSIVGSRRVVRQGLEQVVAQTGADEIIVASQIYDHAARLHSYEIAIEAASEVAPALELQNASMSARGGIHGGTARGQTDDRAGTFTSENPLPDAAP